jgi:hypothetical protein
MLVFDVSEDWLDVGAAPHLPLDLRGDAALLPGQVDLNTSPNFTRSPVKLLISLYVATFCSHNSSLIFILTSTWVLQLCESTETKYTVKHCPSHTRAPLPEIVVSARLVNRVIRIAYVVAG